jgi:hypothetical protein
MTINVTHTSGSSSSWGSGRSQTIHPGGWAAIGHYKDGTGNWPCPGQGFIIAGLQERYHRHPCYAQFNAARAFTIPGKYHIYNKDNVVYMVTPYFKKVTLCYPHNGW